MTPEELEDVYQVAKTLLDKLSAWQGAQAKAVEETRAELKEKGYLQEGIGFVHAVERRVFEATGISKDFEFEFYQGAETFARALVALKEQAR